MSEKLAFLDVETTGTNPYRHGIHQVGMILTDGGNVVEEINLKLRPFKDDVIDPEALEVGGITGEQIRAYPPAPGQFQQLLQKFDRFVDKFDRTDKATIVGYNCRPFDIPFLRQLWKKNGHKFFGSYFNNQPVDVMDMVFARKAIDGLYEDLPDYKLKTLADEHGIRLDDAHDALADIRATRSLFQIFRRRAQELERIRVFFWTGIRGVMIGNQTDDSQDCGVKPTLSLQPFVGGRAPITIRPSSVRELLDDLANLNRERVEREALADV